MAVSRRRFLTRSLVAGAAVPLAGTGLSALGLSGPAAAAPGKPRWAPTGGGSTLAVDEEMTVTRTRLAPTAAEAGADPRRALAVGIAPFAMLGASFAASSSSGAIGVRALLPDGWSPWLSLALSSGHGPDRPETGLQATDPVWVGGATGFEVAVPPGLNNVEIHLVAPTGRRVVTAPTATGSAAEVGGYRIPAVRPRAEWGAAPYRGTVDTADDLERAVIHHTVNGNRYSAAEVPSMLRSIQAYHQNSRGWDDIGYNFVIDRFGTIWEGRASSLYQPVIGAHAQGANDGSVGVAYLGDGTSIGLTSTAIDALGRFLGWKLPLHGVRPSRTNIVGHRDVGQTACPGNILYPQLDAIRDRAIALAAPVGPFFDVPATDPRAADLRWGRGAGVIDARPDGTFGPALNVNRADNIYWLWRLAGRPLATQPHGFTDVPARAYYRDALRWARRAGIVRMTASARFSPAAAVTRQRAVLQLWRHAGQPDPSVPHTYTDVPPGSADEVAYDWADASGLVTTDAFGRAGRITRTEAVALLRRLPL